jgi:hypothetical protein
MQENQECQPIWGLFALKNKHSIPLTDEIKADIEKLQELCKAAYNQAAIEKDGCDLINYNLLRNKKVTDILRKDGVLEYLSQNTSAPHLTIFSIIWFGLKHGLEQVKYIDNALDGDKYITDKCVNDFENNTVPFLKHLKGISGMNIETDINLNMYDNEAAFSKQLRLVTNKLNLYSALGGDEEKIGIKQYHRDSYKSKLNNTNDLQPTFLKIAILDSRNASGENMVAHLYEYYDNYRYNKQNHLIIASLLRIEQDVDQHLMKLIEQKVIGKIDIILENIKKYPTMEQCTNALNNLKDSFKNIDYTQEALPQLKQELIKTKQIFTYAKEAQCFDKWYDDGFFTKMMNYIIDFINGVIWKFNSNKKNIDTIVKHVDKVCKQVESKEWLAL